MTTLAKRVATAIVLLAVLLAAIFLLPTPLFAWVLVALMLPAAFEWARLAGLAAGARLAYALGVGALALALLRLPAAGFAGDWPPPLLMAICGTATVFWIAVATPWVAAGWPLRPRALVASIGALVLVATWMALVTLHARSPWTLLAAMGVVFVADTAAFFAGRRFGRRKLAPRVSPGKTWEGVFGALAGVAVYAAACAWWSVPAASHALDVATWVGVALVLTAFGIVGDLFESWLKREAGVKDSGDLLPGHGGVLDRVDALLAAMPPAALAASALLR
jgi:phosphatidate cytidylyltransferase